VQSFFSGAVTESDIPASSDEGIDLTSEPNETIVEPPSVNTLHLPKINIDPYKESEDEQMDPVPPTFSEPLESSEDLFDMMEEFEYEYLDDLDLQKYDTQPTNSTSAEDLSLLQGLFDDDKEDKSPDSALKADLVVWALDNNIGRNALTDLLHVLRENNNSGLPKCSKTLMKTPRSTVHFLKKLCDGIYWYYGILKCLSPRLTESFLKKLSCDTIIIDIFIDGVSPYKSVRTVLWPICGCIVGTKDIFVIAMWCGTKKEPSDQNIFIEDFIKEAEMLMEGFSFEGLHLKLKIRNIIADAPARTWIKKVNKHGSYNACER